MTLTHAGWISLLPRATDEVIWRHREFLFGVVGRRYAPETLKNPH